jgi:hypothetical protein
MKSSAKAKTLGRAAAGDGKVDRESEDSFPASDPPSYAGGEHRVGEPFNPAAKEKRPSKHRSQAIPREPS